MEKIGDIKDAALEALDKKFEADLAVYDKRLDGIDAVEFSLPQLGRDNMNLSLKFGRFGANANFDATTLTARLDSIEESELGLRVNYNFDESYQDASYASFVSGHAQTARRMESDRRYMKKAEFKAGYWEFEDHEEIIVSFSKPINSLDELTMSLRSVAERFSSGEKENRNTLIQP